MLTLNLLQETLLKATKASKSKKKKETADGRDGRRRKNPDTEGDSSAKKQKAEKKALKSAGGDSNNVSQGSWKGNSSTDTTTDSRSKQMIHFVPQINPNIRFATYTKENGRTLVVQDQPVAVGTTLPSFSVIANQASLRAESVRSGSKVDIVESITEAVTSGGVTPTTVRISDTLLSSATVEESDKSGWAIGEVILCLFISGGVLTENCQYSRDSTCFI